eukprot:scaffold97676_cov57-Phaeocystis_antarctica.AAC.2
MLDMFAITGAFNQPLHFDTSKVTNMWHMFTRASAFNQPLSWDTSSVTDMGAMFNVRSSPCPAPNLQPSPPLHAACTADARCLPGRTPLHTACPPFDSWQHASAFNQPLSFDTSSVTTMTYMFYVRSSPGPVSSLQSSPPLHTLLLTAAYALPLPATRQGANSLSNANKLRIRCAWAGTSAFVSAGYGSSWGPGTCPATFTDKASLKTAVQAYNANPTAAIATYGPIADWDVSAITDMRELFKDLKNFNADVSNWDTSSVTTMYQMFRVRSTPVLPPICSRALHCTLDAVAPVCWPEPRPAPYSLPSTLGRKRMRSTSR